MFFKFDVDIFKHSIVVFQNENDDIVVNEMSKFGFNKTEIEDSLNMTENTIGRCVLLDGGYVIVRISSMDMFSSYTDMLITISHESNHAVMFILDKIGSEIKVGISDEVLCYLQAHIFSKILENIKS